MFSALYQYLILHKQVSLPGVGTFSIQRQPAQSEFANKSFAAPVYSVLFDRTTQTPAKSLFAWLAACLNISDREAIIRFNDFVFDIKKRISAGEKINWKGVGVLQNQYNGEIKFDGISKELVFEKPVATEKVIRENAEHTMLVGEQEKTSVEMTELLKPVTYKKDIWWVYAMAVAVLLVIFIGWYLSENGLKTSSTGYQRQVTAQETNSFYPVNFH